MKRTSVKLAAALAGIALSGAACGGGGTSGGSAAPKDAPTTAQAAATKGGPDAGASELRAGLTDLLEEHVYLTSFTTGMALQGQDTKAPAATLDANSVELSKAIASVYGEAGGVQFLDLWRKHIGFFVDYTNGKARNDPEAVTKAKAELDGYRADFGAFIESATKGGLPKQGVADELKMHVDSLLAAIDAQAAKSPNQTELLKKAADHMTLTAAVLAGGISKQFPDKFSGASASTGAGLRATLTATLVGHVYLAGITTGTALSGADAKPPSAVLDENTVELANAVSSVYGDAGGKQFLDLWRKHIGFFVDYTTGRATGDEAMVAKARQQLDGYRADFGAFVEAASKGGLTKQAVADELSPHVQSLEAAIDAQAKKDPAQSDALSAAAGHMPMTADLLAGAIAKQFPDRFGA